MSKMPYYTLDELQDLIQSPAEELGWKSQDLIPKLKIVSAKYVEAIDSHAEAGTRRSILRSLDEAAKEPDESLAGKVSILPLNAIQAMMGYFPNTLLHYTDLKSHDHVAWIVNDDTVMKAAFQSQMALQSQHDEPTLIRVELNPKGYGNFVRGDEDIFRSCLISIAEVDFVQIRQLIRYTINSLTIQFDIMHYADNKSILSGARAGAEWQLYNLFLDEIWPIENGEFHSKKMMALREVLQAVMIYVWGPAKKKHGKGNKLREVTEGPEDDKDDFFFDKALFSAVLTLRHQINSLNRALEIASRRFAEIEASRDSFEEPGACLNALDRLALYPLRDWMNELKRRLEFGDYRPTVLEVGRMTGEILRTPVMPKFKRKTTEYERMYALIEAAGPLVRGKRDIEKDKSLLLQAFSPI